MSLNDLEFIIDYGEDYRPVVQKIVETSGKVFFLEGELGAGKTTFVSQVVDFLNTEKEDASVMSPTFSLVNEYHLSSTNILHADFYRIKNDYDLEEFLEELEDFDYAFIEWPEKLKGLKESLPKAWCLNFLIEPSGARKLKLFRRPG